MIIEDFYDIKVFDDAKHKLPYDTRVIEFNDIIERIRENKDGLKIEFGVYKGETLKYLSKNDSNSKWYGFDSFVGLPEPWEINKNKESKEKILVANRFDVKEEIPTFDDNVELRIGWFKDTIPTFIEEQKEGITCAFLNIDCDLYSSTKTILENFNDLIVPGTIIRFDELCDWRHQLDLYKTDNRQPRKRYTNWREHEWMAMNEWMEIHEREIIPLHRNWNFGATVEVIK